MLQYSIVLQRCQENVQNKFRILGGLNELQKTKRQPRWLVPVPVPLLPWVLLSPCGRVEGCFPSSGTPAFPQATKKLPIWSYIPWYIPLSDVNPIKSMKVPIKLLASYSVIPASRYAFLLVDLFPNTRPGQPCPARTTSPHGACRIKVRPSSQVIVG